MIAVSIISFTTRNIKIMEFLFYKKINILIKLYGRNNLLGIDR